MCRIILNGLECDDVRFYSITVNVTSETSKTELVFNGFPNQAMLQEIPVTNKLATDCNLKVNKD